MNLKQNNGIIFTTFVIIRNNNFIILEKQMLGGESMLVLILVLVLIFFITFLVLRVKYPGDEDYDFDVHDFFSTMSVILGLALICLLIVICILIPKVATESVIDKKIEMYQEENSKIEEEITAIVQERLKSENDDFIDQNKEKNAIVLVTLFPEFKSNEIVQKQLANYFTNNTNIMILKEEKIDLAKIRWILYFGK